MKVYNYFTSVRLILKQNKFLNYYLFKIQNVQETHKLFWADEIGLFQKKKKLSLRF
jgi:hypothetical protein